MQTLRRTSNARGFTAVEIAMVASVIAILALLVLPIFRERAEEARVAAAQDEVASLVKALLLVEADMPGGGFLIRLNDLDNRSFKDDPSSVGTAPSGAVALEPPRAVWVPGTTSNPGFFAALGSVDFTYNYNTIVQNWTGPYVAYRNTISLREVAASFPEFTDQNFGPIAIFQSGIDSQSLDNDRYPVDPWGSPYLLFGPEETIYNVRAVYSVGPDGAPGPIPGNPIGGAADFDRRNGVLGANGSDDIYFEF